MIGFRRLAVLVLSGVLGIVLAITGWSNRNVGLVANSVAGMGTTGTQKPPASKTPHAGPSAGSSTQPLLSSEPFASYSYQVWPGTPSAIARQAASGLTIKVSRQGSGISVQGGVTGQTLPAPHFYPAGAKVYVVESSLSDDAPNVDYNLGDDGLIVTDANGRILQ
jgi:hypothetical protein